MPQCDNPCAEGAESQRRDQIGADPRPAAAFIVVVELETPRRVRESH